MMKSLLLVSTRTGAGKTTVGLGLGLRWQNSDYSVGYFKPWGDRIVQDEGVYDRDAAVFEHHLGLDREREDFSVLYDYQTALERFRERGDYFRSTVTEQYEKLRKSKDIMLVEGPRNYSFGTYAGLGAADIGSRLDLKAVIVANGDLGVVVDKVLTCSMILERRGVEITGVIVNDNLDREKFENQGRPAIEEEGLDVLGVIPHHKTISQLTPSLIAEELSATVLAGKEGLERPVDNTHVGAMTVSRALTPMRKSKNSALITGGDRTDMQLASFEVSTSCLILTGGIYPEQIVLSKAEEEGVPVLLVSEYTYNTARKVETLIPILRPEQSSKVQAVQELIGDWVEIDALAERL